MYSSNSTGNYQGAYLENIYAESTPALNPLTPPRSPFPGLGIAGFIAGMSSGAASFQIAGNGGTQGAFASGGTGTTAYSYFIVANDTTAGTDGGGSVFAGFAPGGVGGSVTGGGAAMLMSAAALPLETALPATFAAC